MENNFVKYRDLLTVNGFNEETDKEEFVFLPHDDEYLIGRYEERCNMLEYGDRVPVRRSVYERLVEAAKKLKAAHPNYKLIVVYGFRAREMQEAYFQEIYEDVKDKFDDELEMYEYIHEKVAVPTVAGHPTGGAVDIGIFDEDAQKIIDFGVPILDWDTIKCYYAADDISQEAKDNRKLLRDLMMDAGFAPYDGEWWHFSYGDKEWAFYYKQEQARYNQISAAEVYGA